MIIFYYINYVEILTMINMDFILDIILFTTIGLTVIELIFLFFERNKEKKHNNAQEKKEKEFEPI